MEEILYPASPVLMVDDEINLLLSYELTLQDDGISNTETCNDSRKVMDLLEQKDYELVMLDLSMPYLSGEKLLAKIKKIYPELPVLIITGNNEIDTAVDCMRHGAHDYILKPIEESRLVSSVRRAIEMREVKRENESLKKHIMSDRLQKPKAFAAIKTVNSKMNALFRYMEAISRTIEPVLITGETGTGKELFAKAFYNLTERKGKFVTVNVAGLDDQMFSDTLFGHIKGAFTDARDSRPGLLQKAAGGVIFLDEIGDMSMQSQIKLLRLLQEKEFYPLGADEPSYTDALVIAATNRDLFEMQENGEFRKDLYYRLNVHQLELPALKDRKDDLPILTDHFVEQACCNLGKKKPVVPKEFYTLLFTYHFPGNIRELRSMIFNAVSAGQTPVLSLQQIKVLIEQVNSRLKEHIINRDDSIHSLVSFGDILPSLKQVQDMLVAEAMKRAGDNQSVAAALVGITRQGFNKKVIRMKEKAHL